MQIETFNVFVRFKFLKNEFVVINLVATLHMYIRCKALHGNF